ncbi:MAG TPA: bifunctional nuclease family protein [Vicinamibacterales bacterium]|nr:bifunctional nuclease family protein [Vicinamibacterales bacterium]
MLIEMQIRGLMLDPVTNVPIVVLRDSDNQRVLPIWVGPVEANAIALQIENISSPRPMAHDLFRRLVAAVGARVTRVVISELRGSTYYAYLELDREGERVLLDARPSDAIAIALRTGSPVFVTPAVLEQARSLEVSSEQADQERLQRWLESLDPDDMGYKM